MCYIVVGGLTVEVEFYFKYIPKTNVALNVSSSLSHRRIRNHTILLCKNFVIYIIGKENNLFTFLFDKLFYEDKSKKHENDINLILVED